MSTRNVKKDDSSRLEHVLKVGMHSMAISGFGPDRSYPPAMGDDLKDEKLTVEPPEQNANMRNYQFYQESYRPDGDGTEITLQNMAKAIKEGYVLSSGTGCDNVVLRTRKDTLLGRVNYWETLLEQKGLIQIGEGSFNKVFLKNPDNALLNRIEQEFGDVLKTGGKNTGYIVIRLGKTDDGEKPITLKRSETLREIYIGGYASYYGIGPTILSSYYKVLPGECQFENEGYEQSLQCKLQMTMTASVAWDGSCKPMLLKNNGTPETPVWALRSNRLVTKFCDLYVELLMKAATVGLFHGDTKLANLLYTMNVNDRGGVVADSMKICMTDFDSEFCVIMPPKDRDCHNKQCIIVACVCMLLGTMRCQYGEESWRRLKDAMRETLARTLLSADNCIMPKEANTLCKFLQNSDYIQERQGGSLHPHVNWEAADGYDGQMLLVSENFQITTEHYMRIRMDGAQWDENERPCIQVTKHDSLFEKVVSYALEDSPSVILQKEVSKRKRESNDSSARPTRRVAR